uniref:Uncharacterized protein n=1 Tax=Rhizophora mucronata TaxID=61149 RepID=A0A2P2P9N7_RHIMU
MSSPTFSCLCTLKEFVGCAIESNQFAFAQISLSLSHDVRMHHCLL